MSACRPPLKAAVAFVYPFAALKVGEPLIEERKPKTMNADSYGEIFLWNRDVERFNRETATYRLPVASG